MQAKVWPSNNLLFAFNDQIENGRGGTSQVKKAYALLVFQLLMHKCRTLARRFFFFLGSVFIFFRWKKAKEKKLGSANLHTDFGVYSFYELFYNYLFLCREKQSHPFDAYLEQFIQLGNIPPNTKPKQPQPIKQIPVPKQPAKTPPVQLQAIEGRKDSMKVRNQPIEPFGSSDFQRSLDPTTRGKLAEAKHRLSQSRGFSEPSSPQPFGQATVPIPPAVFTKRNAKIQDLSASAPSSTEDYTDVMTKKNFPLIEDPHEYHRQKLREMKARDMGSNLQESSVNNNANVKEFQTMALEREAKKNDISPEYLAHIKSISPNYSQHKLNLERLDNTDRKLLYSGFDQQAKSHMEKQLQQLKQSTVGGDSILGKGPLPDTLLQPKQPSQKVVAKVGGAYAVKKLTAQKDKKINYEETKLDSLTEHKPQQTNSPVPMSKMSAYQADILRKEAMRKRTRKGFLIFC